MKATSTFVALLICLSVSAADEEWTALSLKDAKVGDWVTYKMKGATLRA